MPETNETPGEQVSNSGNYTSDAGNSQQQVDWKARFDGQVKKIEELVITNRKLQEQLDGKTSEHEQLASQLNLKDVEKKAAIDQRDKQLEEVVKAKTEAEKELEDLRALKLKVEVANELKDTSLLTIMDKIPNMTDKEALKNVLQSFSDFAKNAAEKREKELLSGVTPPLNTTSQNAQPAMPTSDEGWQKHLNSLVPGSPEKAKAMEGYWDWLEAAHK